MIDPRPALEIWASVLYRWLHRHRWTLVVAAIGVVFAGVWALALLLLVGVL